ncbi:hypothetical protein [Staphylococcus phage vB_SauM-T-SE-G1]|nr:hypothetical protein [Staphylococcus phage vB_SauM-V1SA15]
MRYKEHIFLLIALTSSLITSNLREIGFTQ